MNRFFFIKKNCCILYVSMFSSIIHPPPTYIHTYPPPVQSPPTQIHAGVIRGRKVAVKVRHPNVAEQIELDFRIMRFLAELANRLPGLRFLNLSESLKQFSHTLASQTHLDIEGIHLVLFNQNFKNWKNIRWVGTLMTTIERWRMTYIRHT